MTLTPTRSTARRSTATATTLRRQSTTKAKHQPSEVATEAAALSAAPAPETSLAAPAALSPLPHTHQQDDLAAADEQHPLTHYAPTSVTNPLGWDLRAVRITRYGPDQRGVLRQYAADPRANTNPPLIGLAGLLQGIDIVPAAAEQAHGGRLYLAIDLQGQLPEQINQLRLRIGTGSQDCNWPVRTALHGLIAGGFGYGDAVGLTTTAGKAIFFVDVLRDSGRAVIPPRGYWSSNEAIGPAPLEILLATNTLRRRLGQSELGTEVFGDLLEEATETAIA